MKRTAEQRSYRMTQGGSVLLEALISILIFSFGVLGLVGVQAAMISGASEAKYRNEAGFHANRLLGEMAVADRSGSMSDFATGGSRYSAWYNAVKNASVSSGLLGLPGADIAANAPTVQVTTVSNGIYGQATYHNVTVTVFWQSPGQPRHQHVTTASISAD